MKARPWLGWLAIFCAVSLLTRAAFFGAGFLNVDEGAHLVGARELLAGGRLYVDFADNKPPLIHVYYAMASAIFGASPFAVRLFSALVMWPAIASCVAAFFEWDRRGRAAAIAFLVASATMLPSDAHAINCEHVFLIPLAASVLLLRSPESVTSAGRMLAVGALVGVASLAKQPAALCGAAFAWCVLRAEAPTSRRLLSLASLAVGFALPLGLAVGIFARQGSLDAFLYWVYRYNLHHVQNPMPLSDRIVYLLKMGSVLIPSAGVLAAAWAWGSRSDAPADDPHRRRLMLGLALTTLLPAFLGWRLFGHYFLPFVFALSFGAGAFFADLRALARRALAAVLVVGFVTFTIAGSIVHDPSRKLADVSDARYARIASALAPRCHVERPLFVWGYAPQIYVLSGLRPASRFVVPIDTITGYVAGNDSAARGEIDTSSRIVPEHWDQLIGDLERSRPEYIVDTAPADLNHWSAYPLSRFSRLDALVRRDYVMQATVGDAAIYRRADCP